MALREEFSADVEIDDIVRAIQFNLLRDDTINALSGLDYATTAQIVAAEGDAAVGDTVLAIETGSLYVCHEAAVWTLQIEGPALAPGKNYIDGLKLSNVGSDFIQVGRGVARDLQDTASIAVVTTFNKDIAEEWAAGTGNGMRDSADPLGAATWFNLYLLGKSTDGTATDLFASTVGTEEILADNLPSGWDRYAFIGSVYWDGGGIKEFFHRGDEFRWKNPVTDLDWFTGTATVYYTTRLTVPALQGGTRARIQVRNQGNIDGLTIRREGADMSGVERTSVAQNLSRVIEVVTNESGEIEYTVEGNWRSDGLDPSQFGTSITTIGWIDDRSGGMVLPPNLVLQHIGDSAEVGEGFLNAMSIWPDDSAVMMIDDNGSAGGQPKVYEMGASKIPSASDSNEGGNLTNMRGPNGGWGGVFNAAGTRCAHFAKNKTTQQWMLTVLDTDDKENISEAGSLNVNSLPTTPTSSRTQGIWDETRDRLYVPMYSGGTHDIRIFDMSSDTPSYVGDHEISGAANRSSVGLLWSENKTAIYGYGANATIVLVPSASGDTFTENIVDTYSAIYPTAAHDGSTLILARRSGQDDVNFLVYSIDESDESDLTDVANVSINGLAPQLTGSVLGSQASYATFRDDIFGCWFMGLGGGTVEHGVYLTFDFSDIENPTFREEIKWNEDPDWGLAGLSQPTLYDGKHTSIMWADIAAEDDSDYEFCVVGYAPA